MIVKFLLSHSTNKLGGCKKQLFSYRWTFWKNTFSQNLFLSGFRVSINSWVVVMLMIIKQKLQTPDKGAKKKHCSRVLVFLISSRAIWGVRTVIIFIIVINPNNIKNSKNNNDNRNIFCKLFWQQIFCQMQI